MTCLNDAAIQAVADREAPAEAVAHAASCEKCAARVQDRQARAAALASAFEQPVAMPATLESRLVHAMTAQSARGATRLRATAGARGQWPRRAWSAAALAAVTLAVVLFVAPLLKGPTTVSAAEVLAKSASQLTATTTGFETLEYELVLDGVPREMMPDQPNGTYWISRVIDHAAPGHFRYTSVAPDGRLLSSIAQDPATGLRVSLMRVDDQYYRFEFAVPAGGAPSLPEIERLHMQATVAMMQASGQQVLQTVTGPDGPAYRIDVPRVSAAGAGAVWDLSEARVVIQAADYRISELSARGTFLKRPYSLSYRLLTRSITDSVGPDAFAVPNEPGEIVVRGDGTANPARDAFVGVLKELARTRERR